MALLLAFVWTQPDFGNWGTFLTLEWARLATALEACSRVNFVGVLAHVPSDQLDFST